MSLKKRGKYWYIDITYPNGERIRKSTKTAIKKEAQELHDTLKFKLWRQEQLGEKPSIRHTWKEAVVRFLKYKGGLKWLKGYTQNLRDLDIWLNDKYLDEIDKALISQITFERKAMKPRSNSGKGETVSNGTVNRMLSTLSSVLNTARDEFDMIEAVPKISMLPESPSDIRWLTKEEAIKLRNELPHHLEVMMIFSILSGLRMGNVTRLKWEQVFVEHKIIVFSHVIMKNGLPFSIPLSDEMIAILSAERGKNDVYIFTYRGRPVKNANTRAFKKAQKRAGIKPLRWHDLRHTFASWHSQNGTPADILQKLGGWKSSKMVERYAHLNIEHLAQFTNNVSMR